MHALQNGLSADTDSAGRPRWSRLLLWSIAVGLGHFLLSLAGHFFVIKSACLAGIWPANGFALAVLVLCSSFLFPWFGLSIFWGAFASSFVYGETGIASLVFASADAAELMCAAWLVNRFLGRPFTLSSLRNVIGFALVCLSVVLLFGLFGAWANVVFRHATSFGNAYASWAFGDTVAMLTLTPFFLTLHPQMRSGWKNTLRLPFWIWIGAFGFVCWFLFNTKADSAPFVSLFPSIFILPFLLWAGLHFDIRGAAAGIMILSLISAFFTAFGRGPFAVSSYPIAERAFALQAVLNVFGLSTLILGAIMAERKRSEQVLLESNRRTANILQSISDCFFSLDQEGRFIYLNPQAERFLDKYGRAAAGGRIWESLPGWSETELSKQLRQSTSAQAPAHFEMLLPRSGEWLDFSLYPTSEGVSVYFRDITERKQAEEELRERELRYKLVGRATNDVIWDWDLDSDQLYWNEAVLPNFGWKREEMGASVQGWYDRIHPRDRDRVLTGIHAAIKGGAETWNDEYLFRRKDGSYRIFFDRGFIGRDQLGKPMRMIGSMVDLTERKRAEEELRRHALLLSCVRDSIIVTDLAGVITYWNEGATRLFGWEAHEMIGRAYWARYPEPARSFIARQIQERADGREWLGEWEDYRKDGSRIWIYARVYRYTDADGRPLGIIGVSHDLTDRKRAEEALKESEDRFRVVAESIPQFIWSAKTDGTTNYYNPQFLTYTGKSLDQIKDWAWLETLHPEDRERAAKVWTSAFQQGQEYSVEVRIRRASDGAYRWFLHRGVPARDAEGTVVRWYGIATDLHEHLELERNLQETQDQLSRLNGQLESIVRERTAALQETIAELERYSYSISHDMRAPLRAMHQLSEMLLEDHANELSGDGKDLLHRIVASAYRMDRLIQDVLSYSQVSRSEVVQEPVNLHALVHQIVDQYPGLKPPDAIVHIHSPLFSVLGNTALLTQCISNLLGNAVKFVAKGVVPKVFVWTELNHDRVLLYIKDNGIGIAPKDQERIFGIFERLHTSAEYDGTGIGLSVVRKAIERMGGEVGLESTVGQGSRFWIRLPAAGSDLLNA